MRAVLKYKIHNHHYANAKRIAAAEAQGVIARLNRVQAPNIIKVAFPPEPIIIASTVITPKMSTGTYNGKISNESNTPPLLRETVKDAPIVPINDNAGVPSNMANNKGKYAASGIFIRIPNNGVIKIRGSDVVTQ